MFEAPAFQAAVATSAQGHGAVWVGVLRPWCVAVGRVLTHTRVHARRQVATGVGSGLLLGENCRPVATRPPRGGRPGTPDGGATQLGSQLVRDPLAEPGPWGYGDRPCSALGRALLPPGALPLLGGLQTPGLPEGPHPDPEGGHGGRGVCPQDPLPGDPNAAVPPVRGPRPGLGFPVAPDKAPSGPACWAAQP